MRTKDGFSVFSSLLFATGASALVASSAIILSAGITLQKLNRAPAVTLTAEPFTWLSNFDLKVAELPSAQLDDGTSLAYPNRLAWNHFNLPRAAGKSSRALFALYHAPQRSTGDAPQPVREPSVLVAGAAGAFSDADQVTWQSAAPDQGTMQSGDSWASEAEQIRMQKYHTALRRTLFTALDTHAPRQSSSLVALSIQYQGLDSIPESDLGQSLDSRQTVAWIADHLPNPPVRAQSFVKRSQAQVAVARAEKRTSAQSNVAQTITQVSRSASPSSIAEFSPQAGSMIALNTQMDQAIREANVQTDRLMAAAAWLRTTSQDEKTLTDSGVLQVKPGQLDTQIADSDQLLSTQGHSVAVATPDYSSEVVVMAPKGPMNTQTAPSSQMVLASAAPSQVSSHDPVGAGVRPEAKRRDVSTFGVAAVQDSQGAAIQYVEAFAASYPIEGVSVDALTQQTGARWELSRAFDHITTLARVMPEVANQTIPLISSNTARLLSFNSGVKIQPEAGIVFGMIPEGWSVELSGRSESGLFFDQSLKPVHTGSTEGARYFVYLNAAPGVQLVQVSHLTQGNGSIAVPVMGATATYVDLSDVRAVRVRGAVYNGSSAQAEGLAKVRVRVAGSAESEKVTDARGRFTLDRVIVAGNYPLVLETDAVTGFTHRYQVSPSRVGGLTLFRMSDVQIQEWIGQLEGGVSPESGMIVAVTPESVVARMEKKPLFAGARSLNGANTLKPEAYSLSVEGDLQHESPIDSQLPRMISVQVPEGPALIEARNSSKGVEWSEMVFAQPGIINIVGP